MGWIEQEKEAWVSDRTTVILQAKHSEDKEEGKTEKERSIYTVNAMVMA